MLDVDSFAMSRLAARLTSRGAPSAPSLHERLALGPPALSARDGSQLLNGQMQHLLANIMRQKTVVELREVCRLSGAGSRGTKDELVRRIAFNKEYETTSADLRLKRRSLSDPSSLRILASPVTTSRRRQSLPAVLPSVAVDFDLVLPVATPQRRRLSCKAPLEMSMPKHARCLGSPDILTPSTGSAPKRRRISSKSAVCADGNVELAAAIRDSPCKTRRRLSI